MQTGPSSAVMAGSAVGVCMAKEKQKEERREACMNSPALLSGFVNNSTYEGAVADPVHC